MRPETITATKWTCNNCGVSTSRIDGEPTGLPETWTSSSEGDLCLVCRREQAGNAALESVPSDGPLDARVRLRRAAVIEFEVRRTPDHANHAIAKACRSSASAVAQARIRLGLPDPPPRAPRSHG